MADQYWTPDTCGCRFAQVVNGGVVELEAIDRKCSLHQSIADGDLYQHVLVRENQRKNAIRRELFENAALDLVEMKIGRVDSEGRVMQPHLDFKNGIDWDWWFEGTGDTRVLKYTVTGVDAKKLDDVHTAVAAKVGADDLAIEADPKAAVVADEVVP